MAEPDYSSYDREGLVKLLKLRDRQAMTAQKYWVRDAEESLNGDSRALRNRVDLAKMPDVGIVQS